MSSYYCMKCGAKNPKTNILCSRCGTGVGTDLAALESPAPGGEGDHKSNYHFDFEPVTDEEIIAGRDDSVVSLGDILRNNTAVEKPKKGRKKKV